MTILLQAVCIWFIISLPVGILIGKLMKWRNEQTSGQYYE